MVRRVLFAGLACALAPLVTHAAVATPPADATAMVSFILVSLLVVVAYILWVRKQQRDSARRREGVTETQNLDTRR